MPKILIGFFSQISDNTEGDFYHRSLNFIGANDEISKNVIFVNCDFRGVSRDASPPTLYIFIFLLILITSFISFFPYSGGRFRGVWVGSTTLNSQFTKFTFYPKSPFLPKISENTNYGQKFGKYINLAVPLQCQIRNDKKIEKLKR